MATESEISGWIWNAQERIRKYRQIVEDCDKQIARLEPVYQALGEIKSDFRSARKSTKEIVERKGIWRGEKHTSFRNAGERLDDVCGWYYHRLDAAHDAVNSKIGELKAKKQELIPIIGDLLAKITQWTTAIKNMGN